MTKITQLGAFLHRILWRERLPHGAFESNRSKIPAPCAVHQPENGIQPGGEMSDSMCAPCSDLKNPVSAQNGGTLYRTAGGQKVRVAEIHTECQAVPLGPTNT
jgi:hypothetical protein